MKYILILLLLPIAPCLAQYNFTTTEVAAKIHFPQFMRNLRLQTMEFLKDTGINMNLDVQTLNTLNFVYRAQNLDVLNHARYEVLEDQIDRVFIVLDKQFLEGANRLDLQDAPQKEKMKFIESLKKEASASVEGILKKLRSEECPVCQRMSVNIP